MKLPAGRRDRPGERSPSRVASVPQDIFFQPPPGPPKRRLGVIISRRVRNLLLAAAVPVVGVVAIFGMLPSSDTGAHVPVPERATRMGPATEPVAPIAGDLRSYAVSASEVAGLSVDAPPGTRMELWVAWEPPVTKEPRVQRLVDQVVLERIVPPTVPEAPPTAILLIAPKSVDEVIYGDIWGRLSVATVPSHD